MPYEVKGKCVYKKDSGAKVGCTKGNVKDYLAALHANEITEVNKLKGGKADELSSNDIAKKFDVSAEEIKDQIKKGKKVESEHTDDEEKQLEIASDHVSEFPDYYDRIEKMEKEAEKHWGEKINESKSLIKKLLRENIQQSSINQQIANQIKNMGLDPNNVDINLNHRPLVYNAQPEQEIEEGAKSYMGKVLITCLIGASGLVSCQKAKTKVMYKCSYKDSRIDKEHLNPNIRATSFYAYDHILSDAEIKAEEAKIEPETEKLLNIDIVDGTLKLEFEEVDTQGKWG